MVTRTGDLFAAFMAGMIVLALILRGMETKRVVLVEQGNGTDKGREHDGNQNRAPSPQNIRTLDTASASA